MSNKGKDTKMATALRWQGCARIREVAEICRCIEAREPLSSELQCYADTHATLVRRAISYLGLKYKVTMTPDGTVFAESGCPGGGVPFAVLRICDILRSQGPTEVRSHAKGNQPPDAFYSTRTWKRLRYDAILKSAGRCSCCGASPKDGAVLNVDHIKPIMTHPELKSEPDNLQVLCADCNCGKGNRDDTDWRER